MVGRLVVDLGERKLRAELRVAELPRSDGQVGAHLDDQSLSARHEDAQLAPLAVAQPDLLGRDRDDAVDAIDEEDRAGRRRDDHAAPRALGDRHLLARVEDVDL